LHKLRIPACDWLKQLKRFTAVLVEMKVLKLYCFSFVSVSFQFSFSFMSFLFQLCGQFIGSGGKVKENGEGYIGKGMRGQEGKRGKGWEEKRERKGVEGRGKFASLALGMDAPVKHRNAGYTGAQK